MNLSHNGKLLGLVTGIILAVSPQLTYATEGYFAHGWGARHMALAGAGVADIADATGQALNPAGLVSIDGSEMNIGAALFNPNRKYEASGDPGYATFGIVESNRNIFLVPNFAYSSKIDDDSAWGVSFYGNGGMNTDYPVMNRPAPDCDPVNGGAGVFCAGAVGVDLIQAFLGLTYSYKMGDLSLGIQPLIAFQSFEARGLQAFIPNPYVPGTYNTIDPTSFSNNDHENSTGFGAKVGLQYDVNETLRLGLSYQTKINMSELDAYSGLFADGGDFDIPSNLTFGMAFDVSDDLTFMLDWKKIWYTDAGSVSNPGFGQVMAQFGAPGGPGFGWDDVTAIKFAFEYDISDTMTWRFGYASNDNPIGPEDVALNILAPGVVTKHISTGFEMDLGEGDAFEFSFTYVPNESVSGPGLAPSPLYSPVVTLSMDQMILGVSWTISMDD